MAKAGRKRKLTIAATKDALKRCAAIRSATAQLLGVHPSTLSRFIQKHAMLAAFEAEVEEDVLDLAESKLLQLIQRGDPKTCMWYLETKGKERGYSRYIEQTGRRGASIEMASKVDLSHFSDEEIEILTKAANALAGDMTTVADRMKGR